MNKGLLKGNKHNQRHSTYVNEAASLIKKANRIKEVKKIVLGIIRLAGIGKRHIKFSPVQAGLRLQVRGVSAVQEIFIYTDEPQAVEAALQKCWEEYLR